MKQAKLSQLKDITLKIGSGATPTGGENSYKAEGITLIRSMNVYDFRFEMAGLAFIDEHQALQLNNVEVAPNDILLNITGASVARCCMVPFDVLPARVNQHVAIVRINPKKADPAYILFCINSPQYKAALFSIAQGGATREALTKQKIETFEVLTPSLATQHKIASILSAYGELIENNDRRIAILESMSQAIYREWFVEFKFPGHESVKSVDSSLGKIPAEWSVLPLKQITSKIGSGATPRGGKEAYKAQGITLIRSLNVYDNQFELDGLAFIDDTQAAQLDNVKVEKRDILLNITGASVARCCMVPSYLLPARVNQHVAIIRVQPNSCDPFYVLNTINDERHKRQILALAQGGATREALTKDTISNYEIVVPSREIFTRYGAVVADLFDQREVLQKKNNCLRKTRDLLLPKIISGQLDVEELDIETSETLMEAEV